MLKKLIILMMITLVLTSCGPKTEESDKSQETGNSEDTTEIENLGEDKNNIDNSDIDKSEDNNDKDSENSINTEEINQDDSLENEEKEEEVLIVDGVISSLNGILYEREQTLNRPVSVMLDNHPSARWQAGICKAEIVYECEVEYPYTRYMAVFMSESPEHVGPVRSARPYYLRFAQEYDSIYVHVGGSQEAMNTIIDYNMADLDGLTSGEFWRYYKTGKEIPNNMYTAMENIRSAQSYLKYRQSGEFEGFDFNEETTGLDSKYGEAVDCTDFKIVYNKSYEVDYEYNSDEQYKRYVNGERQLDEYYEEKINASNIIIQKVDKEVVDNYGRIHLNTVSEGSGYFVTNGKCIDITWKKDSYKSKTMYLDSKGDEIILNPGQTWIQVISQDSSIEF